MEQEIQECKQGAQQVQEQQTEVQAKKNKQKQFKKRKAVHQKPNLNEVYVKNNTHITIYIKRIHRLIKEGAKTIIIHGMTASIPKCVQIALHMAEYYSDIKTEIETSSANTIIDRLPDSSNGDEDNSEEEQMEIKVRSTIHITLKKELNF